ncbi:MAG TPA: phosphate ABC transporter permease PstA [bacterium]|nr:phosphate ABC transporter permease PstA [bacterium]
MRPRSKFTRIWADRAVKGISGLAVLAGLALLAWILYTVLVRGAAALHWDFFTQLPAPPGGSGGGLGNAMLGTVYLTLLAAAMGVPVGIFAGVYLSEYGHSSRFGHVTRFMVNTMMGIPSIIAGLFVYTILVVTVGHFSGYAGAVALALLILPIVARTTEDMLNLVPVALRESALALGVPRWKVTLGIVFRAARNGLVSGVLLAVARVSGETAPLLFTALNSPYWPRTLSEPTANLTVTIFNYAMSPYDNWQNAAWGASFLITVAVLLTTVVVRVALLKGRSR